MSFDCFLLLAILTTFDYILLTPYLTWEWYALNRDHNLIVYS